MIDLREIEIAIEEVRAELKEATLTHGSFKSAHEGYAVILEEADELWEEVKKKKSLRDRGALREEAMQVAAMAIRFMVDCT